MYKVQREIDAGTKMHYRQDWKDLLMEGGALGLYLMFLGLVGIVILVATPFYAAYAVYEKWRDGGVHCEQEEAERNREVFKQ